jgi:hypothetical protein
MALRSQLRIALNRRLIGGKLTSPTCGAEARRVDLSRGLVAWHFTLDVPREGFHCSEAPNLTIP